MRAPLTRNSLREHLKETTWPLHNWLETSFLLNQLREDFYDEKFYIKLLSKLFILTNIIEDSIILYKDQFIKTGLNDIDMRIQKSKWIREDLKNLGFKDFDKLHKNIEFKTLDSFESLLGALYVLEGSTMGGLKIEPIIKQKLSQNTPCRYYSGYKDKIIPMWINYCNYLDSLRDVDFHKVTLCACEVFIKTRKLLDEQ